MPSANEYMSTLAWRQKRSLQQMRVARSGRPEMAAPLVLADLPAEGRARQEGPCRDLEVLLGLRRSRSRLLAVPGV